MQTITVREAESQLQALVKQAQSTHQPVILTNEMAAPVAVLTAVSDKNQDQNATLAWRLEILESVMQMWQQYQDDANVCRDAVQLAQSQLRQLGTLVVNQHPAVGALLMLLRLAMPHVTLPTPSGQLQALAFGVARLGASDLSWADVEQVDKILLASDIDARANFSDLELLNAYVDAS